MQTPVWPGGSSVTEIAASVANRSVSVAEIADEVLRRIREVDPVIQSFSQFDEARLVSDARQLDQELTDGSPRGPLHGVPVAIKEWFDVEGFPTLLRGPDAPVETVDATLVARLRAAGALVAGKTVVPLGEVPPPTRNPWNTDHTAGGSSSGAAAAVSARLVPMSLGEQTGGSNLRPAAFCGLAGLKPTYGLLSRRGMYPGFWSRDHPGLIGLAASDLALVLSAIAGYDPEDRTTIEAPPPTSGLDGPTEPRIGILRNFFPELTGSLMMESVESAAQRLEAAGAQVIDVQLPDEFGAIWDAGTMLAAEYVTHRSSGWASTGKPVTVQDLGTGTPAINTASRRATELLPATYYLQARRIRSHLIRIVTQLFRDLKLDSMLLAVSPDTAPRGFETTGNPILLVPWSFLGFPAATVNSGMSPDGLPIGVQLVRPQREDRELLGVAEWCESVFGILPPPPISGASK